MKLGPDYIDYFKKTLTELREASKRPFGGHERNLTIHFDMSVIPGYQAREAVRLGISPAEVNTLVLFQKGYSTPEYQSQDNGLVAAV